MIRKQDACTESFFRLRVILQLPLRVDLSVLDRARAATVRIARTTPEFRALVGTATRCPDNHCRPARRARGRLNVLR